MKADERNARLEFLRQALSDTFNAYEKAIEMKWVDLERVFACQVVDIDFKIAELLNEK